MIDCSGVEVNDNIETSDGEILNVVFVGAGEFVMTDEFGSLYLNHKECGESCEGLDDYNVTEIIKGNG